MNSFNHYAFGAVGDWMYRTIGGINLDPGNPGAKRVRIAPRPGGGLTRARTSLETLYGTLATSWQLDGQTFRLDVTIPPNTSAEVVLPSAKLEQVREGGHAIAGQQQGDDVLVTVGSGKYQFTVSR